MPARPAVQAQWIGFDGQNKKDSDPVFGVDLGLPVQESNDTFS
jgi:hypothetical protein